MSNQKLSPISGSGILDVDISDALCKRDLQNLKNLIFNAKKKHCHFSKQIRDLACRVISCEILSQTEIDLLKYKLDLALENVNETDPEIECLIQRTFTNFEEEEQDTAMEENQDELQVQNIPISQNPVSETTVLKPVIKSKAPLQTIKPKVSSTQNQAAYTPTSQHAIKKDYTFRKTMQTPTSQVSYFKFLIIL